MNKAIFLDRDGTINVDFGYVYKTQELELLPGVAEALRIFQELGYLLIVITTNPVLDVATLHWRTPNSSTGTRPRAGKTWSYTERFLYLPSRSGRTLRMP